MLQISSKFVDIFRSITRRIAILTITRCSWRMTTKCNGEKAIIDQGWVAFAIARVLRVGYFLTFCKEALPSVVIFDYTSTEVMTRCPDH
jgi:hypothetical protein